MSVTEIQDHLSISLNLRHTWTKILVLEGKYICFYSNLYLFEQFSPQMFLTYHNLSIISISKNKVELTTLTAEIWEHDNIHEKKSDSQTGWKHLERLYKNILGLFDNIITSSSFRGSHSLPHLD